MKNLTEYANIIHTKRIELTLLRRSPYLDQNVTLHADLWPVCLLNTEHDEKGGEYKCRETAGFTVLKFSTRCSPILSKNTNYFLTFYE